MDIERNLKKGENHVPSYLGTKRAQIWGVEPNQVNHVEYGTW